MDFPNPPYIFRAPQVYPRPECMQVMFVRALDVGLCSIFKRYGGILLSFVDLLLLYYTPRVIPGRRMLELGGRSVPSRIDEGKQQ
jgi:hypothetical protein